MMDESHFRKLRNLISTCPKSICTWGELATGSKTLATADNSYEATTRLVHDFLNLASGGQVWQMLDDVLSPRDKKELPELGSLGKIPIDKFLLDTGTLCTHSNVSKFQILGHLSDFRICQKFGLFKLCSI
jgi:hypothetical protein